MMYKLMEMPDKTEITHSDMREDGTVRVCFEQPVADGFKTCYWELPTYRNFDVEGYGENELADQRKYLESMAHLIIRFSRNGGFENASGFKMGPYLVNFWSDEREPLEPVHVHISIGEPVKDATKVWLTKSGGVLWENNNSRIPAHTLRNIMDAIEAQHAMVCMRWLKHFEEISFYC